MWTQDKMDVKSTWIPTWHLMDQVSFMVNWYIFKNHHLEIGLPQNRKTMALWTLTIIDLFCFTMRDWGTAWIEIHWKNIWLRTRSHMTSHYTWGFVTTLDDFGSVCLGTAAILDTFFWALTISRSRLLALSTPPAQIMSAQAALKAATVNLKHSILGLSSTFQCTSTQQHLWGYHIITWVCWNIRRPPFKNSDLVQIPVGT